jgi:hypothetical protein
MIIFPDNSAADPSSSRFESTTVVSVGAAEVAVVVSRVMADVLLVAEVSVVSVEVADVAVDVVATAEVSVVWTVSLFSEYSPA